MFQFCGAAEGRSFVQCYNSLSSDSLRCVWWLFVLNGMHIDVVINYFSYLFSVFCGSGCYNPAVVSAVNSL